MVKNVYLQHDYHTNNRDTIKYIAVGSWTPDAPVGFANALTHVTADFVKLRKNYIVRKLDGSNHASVALCDKALDGLLLARVLDSATHNDNLTMHLAVELWRCSNAALVWRAEATSMQPLHNSNLATLTKQYQQTYGAEAAAYVAPSFVMLQQLLQSLPDPVLNDADIAEKIEIE